ncbi:BspA family leucine-rich repeat surface protein [Lentilactobacillus hilgardii]|uniref:BspA family leucine-rich repeat surface protein n=1 Tax=Lentilactobacillus hilgardii TaxID=1588 RepID=UPI0021A8D51F|nr:BspA family leucine-rich repeat surface protein [Lentilactobacillus hilgardii]MCT3399543.1 BspA family leucine-rich repeat surface protein [Lentilactobacillus hilgardii]
MNKNYKSYLYIFVSALFMGAGSYLCSTNVLADVNNPIAQVAKTNSQIDNLTNGKQVALDVSNVQANSIQQTQQAAAEDGSRQVEDVSYSIDNGTLTLSGGTLTEAHKYPWQDDDTITKVQITGPLKLEGRSAASFLSGMENLKSIIGMDEIDTSKATDMSYMFFNDPSLIMLDVSHFDTSNVTSMEGTFNEDYGLTSIDVSNFNTSKVTNMSYMFYNDFGLKSLDVSNFDTSNVINMEGMFGRVSYIPSLDVSNFNTSKVTNMAKMFSSDVILTNLDLSNFDTSEVINMYAMFYGDYGLKSLDISGFDTSKVINVSDMFYTANRLSTLKLGSKTLNDGLNNTKLPGHSSALEIPDSNPVRYATGSGWLAVDENNGGTVDNPQGKTVYDGYLGNRPAEAETYVWQQDSKPVTKQTITVGYIDAATGKPIPGVKAKMITGFQGREYDVSKADSRPDISGYTWDGKIPTNAKGVYGDKDIVVQYVYHKNTTPSTPGTPINPGNNNSQTVTSSTGPSSSASSSSSSSSTPTVPTTAPKPYTSVGPNIAVKGEAVYATKKIGLYKSTNFKKSQRIAWYPKQNRVNRPMFVVTGYKRTSNGTLRYKVRDVNHDRKTDGNNGYITASRKYVVPVYYASVPKAKKITVLSKKGVNAYKSANLTGKVKHYKKGVHLTVKKLVKHNLTTRYQLSNGHYITANKKLIIAGNY